MILLRIRDEGMFILTAARIVKKSIEEIYAAIGMGEEAFSAFVDALLGRRETYPDSLLRAYAEKASLNKNIKNCMVYFSEEDLYAVLKASLSK